MLNFIFKHMLFTVSAVVLVFFFLACSAALEAYLDFKKRPGEAMFWCYKHGHFRKQHCLQLFPEMGGTAENSFICPICYREAVFTIPNKTSK